MARSYPSKGTLPQRKLIPLLALAVLLFCLFLYSGRSAEYSWRGLPHHIHMDEHGHLSGLNGEHEAPVHPEPDFVNWNPKPQYQPGSPLPADHNYTSVLIIAKTKREDVKWIQNELSGQETAIYIADDPYAPLHPPKNKGHEVMIYLSWIIDNYDALPDVAIFMHAHQYTWHNDDLLSSNAADMVRRLSRPRVWREGFVNMRCNWFPGCPDWMHPDETEKNDFKQEEHFLAKSWSELFPLDPVPSVLAQPCCAQFALSRERIQAKPHAQYLWYRNWLFSTKLTDSMSGRIWEYVWQFVFTGENVYCPKEHICFCDQFGYCFGGEDEFKEFLNVKREFEDRERDLRDWEDKKRAWEEKKEREKEEEEKKKKEEEEKKKEKEEKKKDDGDKKDDEKKDDEKKDEEKKDEEKKDEEKIEPPEEGKDEEFRKEVERLKPLVEKLKREAIERGEKPEMRAKEAGRAWKEGDGF